LLGDVILKHGLIANQRQRHERRACHEDHRAKVGVRVLQQVGEEELLSVKIVQRTILTILREKGGEVIKSASFFDQVMQYKGDGLAVHFLGVVIQLCSISLESLKVLVNIESHKFSDVPRSTSRWLNLTESHF
jgi:hypothetical protein